MNEKQRHSVNELKRQLQVLENTLSEEEKLLQAKSKDAVSLSSSIVEAENAIHECEEELRQTQAELEDAMRSNRIAHKERLDLEQVLTNHLEREEYMKEISGADESLKETQAQVESVVDQVKISNDTPVDANTRRQLALVNLIAMLNDLHTSLSRSVQRVPINEDIKACELLKAIRELSRERERTLGYCLRKKREISSVIELKKQRTNELILESQKNVSILCDDQDKRTLHVVERIQAERRLLEDEVSKIEATNERLWESLRDTKYSSDNVKSGEHKREVALSANDVLHGSPDIEGEKEYLREQLKLLGTKKQKLQRMTEDLKGSMNRDTEKHAQKLKDLRREIHSQQRESHRIEGENRKLKSLCDSLAKTLESM